MHMTFDRKTPKSEITLRLALAKPTRHHGKRHGVGDHKKLSAKKKRRIAHKNAVTAKRVQKMKRAAKAYWSGETDELKVAL